MSFVSKFKIVLLGCVILFSSCAKETSEEDRRREEQDRKLERLRGAEGVFHGYLKKKHGVVPVKLDISAQRSSSNQKTDPSLRAVLEIGFFGGVTVSTNKASFDTGNGLLVIEFGEGAAQPAPEEGSKSLKSPTPGSSLELRGYINGDAIEDAVLDGAHQGQNDLVLDRHGDDLISEKLDYFYQINDEKNDAAAVLTVKRSSTERPAPANSDLPASPPLDASLKFLSLGITPQNATSVLYDPIAARIDAVFSPTSKLVLQEVYLPRSAKLRGRSTNVENLAGNIELAGTNFAQVTANSIRSPKLVTEEIDLPPAFYTGTFQGTGLKYNVIAFLDYLGSSGRNTAELPFAEFPRLRLNVTICLQSSPYRQKTLNLSSVDYLHRQLKFESTSGDQKDILNLGYSFDWQILDGKFIASSSAGSSGSTSRVELSPSNAQDETCGLFN